MTISEYKKLQANDTLMIGLDVSEEKTNRVMNRILEVEIASFSDEDEAIIGLARSQRGLIKKTS